MKNNFFKIFLFVGLIFFLFLVLENNFFSAKKANAAWYSSGGSWSYRKTISTDPQKVASTTGLNNFPMLFNVTDPDLKFDTHGGRVASSTGGDILFTDSDGSTLLDFEIEKYASTTGEIVAWIRIPFLSSTSTNKIYIYYGNSNPANNQNPAGVWDSNYAGVWHLKDGTNLSLSDSTSNANSVATNAASAANGKIDGGMNPYARINDSNSLDITSGMTISTWIYSNRVSGGGPLISKSNNYGSPPMYHLATDATAFANGYTIAPSCNIRISSTDYIRTSTTRYSSEVWHLITCTYDGSNLRLYVNGVEPNSATSATGNIDTNTQQLGLGRDSWSNNFAGVMDEIRVLSGSRSADWIKTEYNNQSATSTFFFYGYDEVQNREVAAQKARSGGSANLQNPSIKIKGGVKFR